MLHSHDLWRRLNKVTENILQSLHMDTVSNKTVLRGLFSCAN